MSDAASLSEDGPLRPSSPMERVEKWFLAILLSLMALLPASEIIARKVFHSGIPGAIQYAQHLTLWVGFLGALLAAGAGKHLSLATGSLIPAGKFREASRVYVGVISAGVCFLLAYASIKLIHAESDSLRTLPGGIAEWWSEVIMPVTLLFMGFRFLWRCSSSRVGRIVAVLVTIVPVLLLIASNLGDEFESLAGFQSVGGPLASFLEAHAASFVTPGILLILLALLLGAPIFVAFSGVAMLLFFGDGGTITGVPTATLGLVSSPLLPAIPLLTAAGYILAEGGASKRFLRLARALFGWAPGGMALMVVVVCAGFTTFTGGSGVTILALGGLVLPMLLTEKYPKGFSLGLVTSSGSLGLLLPPSIPVILYAVFAKASHQELYIAGFLPSILLIVLVGAYAVFIGIKSKAPRQSFSLKEAGLALWECKWELAIPAIVVLAIFTGFATMVEAAALALIAAVISQAFIFKDLHWRKSLPGTLARSAILAGAVLILLGVAKAFADYLVEAQVPSLLLDWTHAHIESPFFFLLALNGVLLVLGSVFEIYAAIMILGPLLVPMAAAYGIDPVHFGVIFLVNLELGFLFPPMGINLILSSSRFNEPLTRLYKVALPFLGIMAVGVLLITYVPAMTTGVLDFTKALGSCTGGGASAELSKPFTCVAPPEGESDLLCHRAGDAKHAVAKLVGVTDAGAFDAATLTNEEGSFSCEPKDGTFVCHEQNSKLSLLTIACKAGEAKKIECAPVSAVSFGTCLSERKAELKTQRAADIEQRKKDLMSPLPDDSGDDSLGMPGDDSTDDSLTNDDADNTVDDSVEPPSDDDAPDAGAGEP